MIKYFMTYDHYISYFTMTRCTINAKENEGKPSDHYKSGRVIKWYEEASVNWEYDILLLPYFKNLF